MTTLQELTDFIVETGQPLMYFNKGIKEYKFQHVEHTKDSTIYPYKHEKSGETLKIEIPKSLKGDIKQYMLDRDNVYSKIKVSVQ